MIRKVGFAAITVADIAASLQFYRDQLGLRVLEGPSGATSNHFTDAFQPPPGENRFVALEKNITLFEFEAGKTRKMNTQAWDPGMCHVALEIIDMDAMYAQTQGKGVHYFAPPFEPQAAVPQLGRIKFTNMRGPSGERISLNEFPDLRSGETADGGFVREINHGAVSVSDIDKSVEYYTEKLGLNLMGGIMDITTGEWDEVIGVKDSKFRTARFTEQLDIVEFLNPRGEIRHDVSAWYHGNTLVGFDVNDIGGFRDVLQQRGVELLLPMDDNVVVVGPDGERLLLRGA